ncbi:hypothetical protein Tco_0633162 [Tanacetum coccineum]
MMWGIVTSTNVDYAELLWEEFVQGIQTFFTYRDSNENSSKSQILMRPESLRHVTGDDFLLGNLKSVQKAQGQAHVGSVAIREPVAEAIRPLLVVKGEDVANRKILEGKDFPCCNLWKAQAGSVLDNPVEEQVPRGNPLSSTWNSLNELLIMDDAFITCTGLGKGLLGLRCVSVGYIILLMLTIRTSMIHIAGVLYASTLTHQHLFLSGWGGVSAGEGDRLRASWEMVGACLGNDLCWVKRVDVMPGGVVRGEAGEERWGDLRLVGRDGVGRYEVAGRGCDGGVRSRRGRGGVRGGVRVNGGGERGGGGDKGVGRFKDLSEADMKEILHDRMFESGTYRSQPEHVALYEALEASIKRDNRDEFLGEKDKSRKRRHDDQDPPPPLDLDISKKKRHDFDASGSKQPPTPQSSAWKTSNTREAPSSSSK